MYADVVLPLPLDGVYTYNIPADLEPHVQVGCRVLVPFGARKVYTAIVMRLHNVKPDYATKDIFELLDQTPILLPDQLKLWQWIADYYLCSIGEVYKAALPSGLKLESESVVESNMDFEADHPLKPSEQLVMDVLSEGNGKKISELQRSTDLQNVLPVVRRLLDMGAVVIKEEVRRLYKPRLLHCVRLSEEFFDEEKLVQLYDALEKRSPKQFELLQAYLTISEAAFAIKMQNPVLLKEVSKSQLMQAVAGSPVSAFNALRTKGIFETYDRQIGRLDSSDMEGEIFLHALSDAQTHALESIRQEWARRPVCLLHGVTSSGKTEVYTHLIKQTLDEGKQVLYLLPEIVLTTQLTERLKRIFGNRLGVYHSRYPDAERVEVYQKMLSEKPYDILLGVRSSIFLPFKNLGLVIIDEEHEQSFKQKDPAPRYHARNAAIMLAHQSGAKVLLGSATPCLESYYNVQSGKYGFVALKTRFQNVQLPRIEVVDVKELQRKRLMKGPFSPQLLETIQAALEQRQQVILFQNRRGYAPTVECNVCGWVPRCQNCDVSLTYHKNTHQLACHYCGSVYPVPVQCPNCEETNIRSHGYGTERIEDLIKEYFPQARVARMDLDTTRSRLNYEQILHDFQQGETDILVGTQMVTKGLDFDRVSVVGILNADSMLNQPDFRSYERAFQMMAQVAGRAGRRNQQGLVILQTRDVESPVVSQVVENDYESLFREQMQERELFNFPPHCRLIYVYVKHRDEHVVEKLSHELAAIMRQVFAHRVMGPDTPFVSRVQLMYIRKVVLKMELSAPMNEARERLLQIQRYLLSQPQYHSAQVYYDVE